MDKIYSFFGHHFSVARLYKQTFDNNKKRKRTRTGAFLSIF